MTGVCTRPATATDLSAVLGLLAQLHPERPEMPDVEDARAAWSAMLEQPGRTVLVAEVDGAVRAVADVLVVPNLTHDAQPWAIVENVVVDEPVRGGGVGRFLMDAVVRTARRAGAYKVQLMSADGREAHAFYEAIGFEARARGFRRYL